MTVAELTQEDYEALEGFERMAVDRLLYLQMEGVVHEASSMNDLTLEELVIELYEL
jgi:hypothetical protein